MASGKPKMTRVFVIAGSIVLIALLAFFLPQFNKKSDTIKIGISQIVEHPALDASKAGFIQRLAELGFEEGKT